MEIIKNPSKRQLLWFGLALGPFVALAGWLFGQSWGPRIANSIWIAGGVLTLVYLSIPPLRRTIFLGWMYAVFPIGWTVSHVVLGLVFYGLLLPIGWIVRVSGHDPLNRRSTARNSYWVERETGVPADRYFRQF